METGAESSPVTQFYEGGHVLITGATGFMGRILLEKLLRVCPGIERVYVIIRDKKEKEASKRLEEVLANSLFNHLREKDPDFDKKITLVPGDCGVLGIGLSEEDKNLLTANLTHVFHSAATVRFDEKLRRAFVINIQGVREILKLCRECPKLKSIVHISTAYSNCLHRDIDEKFYKPSITGVNALKLLDCLEDELLEAITKNLVKPWPNTYAFSKCIAEDVVKEEGKGLPIAIVRPSIVVGCNKEPIPGWIDNIYGPTGVVIASATGLMRTLCSDPNKRADMVPVDMAINAVICAAWDVGTKEKNVPKLEELAQNSLNHQPENGSEVNEDYIFNFVQDNENPVTWRDFEKILQGRKFKIPPTRGIWFCTFSMTKYWTLYKIQILFYHLIPAYFFDAALFLTGNKPQLVAGYKKIHKFSEVIAYFATKEWNFKTNNTKRLWSRLTPKDKRLFHFNMKDVKWREFHVTSFSAMRFYILGEDASTIPAGKRRMLMFAAAHYTLLGIIYFFLAYFIYQIISILFPSVLFFTASKVTHNTHTI